MASLSIQCKAIYSLMIDAAQRGIMIYFLVVRIDILIIAAMVLSALM
jgi:hypothetical protein